MTSPLNELNTHVQGASTFWELVPQMFKNWSNFPDFSQESAGEKEYPGGLTWVKMTLGKVGGGRSLNPWLTVPYFSFITVSFDPISLYIIEFSQMHERDISSELLKCIRNISRHGDHNK